jgi:hypothetical protein
MDPVKDIVSMPGSSQPDEEKRPGDRQNDDEEAFEDNSVYRVPWLCFLAVSAPCARGREETSLVPRDDRTSSLIQRVDRDFSVHQHAHAVADR